MTNTRIGVLGGGQLGRMMIQSGIDFNLDIAVMDPNPEAPCASLTANFTTGDLKSYDDVMAFGKDLDLITIEIEHVNTKALSDLQKQGKKVFPQPEIIELIQDKRKQKTFYKSNRLPTADFVLIENREELRQKTDLLPAVNKLGKEGYDGRGVQIIRNEMEVELGFDAPGLLETLVDFEKEISVIVSRNEQGQVSTFPVVELVFHPTANLVEFLFSPAKISEETSQKASEIAVEVIEKLGMVGLLAVEMFVTKEGEILINEIAPRTHNSGHQTIEANHTSQFEQHIRSILGLPPGETNYRMPSAMVNLLGEEGYTGQAKYQGLNDLLALSNVHLHLYGKKMTKPYRKMGHITVTGNTSEEVQEKARIVKDIIKVIA